MGNNHQFEPYQYSATSNEQLINNSTLFYEEMNTRRSVRDFSNKEVPIAVIENIIKTASTAPSGAHKQPWTFCVVSNVEIKKKIRIAAEKEEYENYNGRMGDNWLADLAKFDTNWQKPFLETAPYLIVVFKQSYGLKNNRKEKHSYVNESVGIATGLLISAIHKAGLVTLTHTPSPLNFLSEVLKRPINEKPYLLIPVGYPLDEAKVPVLERKHLDEIVVYYT
jgi:iodotyrosine deiodinase